MSSKKNVIIIIGPTGVGKTKLSIEVAKEFDCEIISADSMQIYKYMNIGTAKVTDEEMVGIPHYLVDEIDPRETFSVADYKDTAIKYIDEIIRKGKTPLIVGGTGLYINSLLYNINYSEVIQDEEYREELMNISIEKGNEYLHRMLEKIDPESAKRLHFNDVRRVIRGLEVYKCTGNTISHYQSISREFKSDYDFIVIGLSMDRQILYKRINQRVDEMFLQGLIDEVKSLINMGYNKSMASMQGIGYKEIIDYINGIYSLDDTIEIIKRESRRYAKRQFTWFKRNLEIQWFDMTNVEYFIVKKNIKEYIANKM